MDFIVGLPPTQKGFNSILVIVDRLTKSAHFILVRSNYHPCDCVEFYFSQIVRLHGVPRTIISDQGPQFTTRFLEHLHSLLGTKLVHSSAYHLQTSDQTERVNQVLEDMLMARVISSKGAWEKWLPLAELSYNNSYQESIQMAPFEVLYYRKCWTPLNWVKPRYYDTDFVEEAMK